MDQNIIPTITVLLSAYNGQDYIYSTIESVLNQSFSNFELIIINDGSVDNTENIVQKFEDSRIRYFKIDNIGLSRALNYGMALAKGQYIARIDQDDLMLPIRLDCQLNFLLSNPNIGLVGSNVQLKNGNHCSLKKMPLSHKAIEFFALFENPLIHSAVMFRRDLFDVFRYSDSEKYLPEDYELWSRMLYGGVKMFNLADPITIYNNVSGSLSKKKSQTIKKNSYRISSSNISKLVSNPINCNYKHISSLYFRIKKTNFFSLNYNYFIICIIFIQKNGINIELVYYIVSFYLKLLRNNYLEKKENFSFRW